ncbi:MAG TPA: adenylate/guanylate cyclase domain-containing protein [Acidimicrobiia bacterium]|nr:adenylate/guanylate cyclase domain-containing protein [Acidimicrobiia bacterium]
MGVGADEPCPLPADPLLAEVAVAARDTGQAAWIVDAQWRFVHVTDDARALWVDKAGGRLGSVAIGHHVFSTESLRVGAGWHFGLTTTELWRGALRSLGGLVLADTDGGGDALRSAIDPSLRDVVDDLVPCDAAARGLHITVMGLPGPVPSLMLATRVRDGDGRLRGTALIGKPAAPMSVLGGMAWERDLPHLERMERFTQAGRHPAAILFADLEGSTALMRTFPTADVFTFSRRLMRAADRCVVEAGGLVGSHLGDGVVAFFPAETSGSESAAASGCIVAARALRNALRDVAAASDLDGLAMRFGLHWGATVFIGKISTVARAEVTALGDDVNATARIEACATGGRILASKDLVERLAAADAAALAIDPQRVVYTRLGDLATATPKARRDAPAVAVCEL